MVKRIIIKIIELVLGNNTLALVVSVIVFYYYVNKLVDDALQSKSTPPK